jgi:hypothetical protein
MALARLIAVLPSADRAGGLGRGDGRHRVGRGLEGAVDVGIGVGCRGEPEALLRRLDQHPAITELAVEREERALSGDGVRLPVVGRRLRREPELEQRADAAPARLQAGRPGRLDEAVSQPRAAPVEPVIEPIGAGLAAGGDDGRADQRVRVVGAPVHRAAVGRLLHHVALAAQCSHREAGADRLGHDGQVGIDAEQLLRAAPADPEAGQHLVEDQQRAGSPAPLAHALQVAGGGHDAAAVAEDRLGDDRCDPVTMAIEGGLERLDVVPGRDQQRVADGSGDAG